MLSDTEKKSIVNSWRLVEPITETVGELFYRRLFELKAEYRDLFPEEMDGQRRKLVVMLNFIVRAIDWDTEAWRDEVQPEDDLFLVVLALGRRHADLYRIPDEAYPVVGEALLWTLDYGLGDAFTAEVRSAWSKLYQLLSRIMIMGGSSSKLAMGFGRRK